MTIPVLTTANTAKAKLVRLGESHDWVSVFWDRRDRSEPEISIIVDGDGQHPKAYLTREVYAVLVKDGTVGPDTLQTFHPRRLHDFKAAPAEESKGPSAADVCEQTIRSIIAERPEWPLQAQFFRGLGSGKHPEVQYEYVETDTVTGGFVRVAPHATEVAVLAMRVGFLGPDLIGEYSAVEYPSTDDGVDLEALAGPEFKTRLVEAIEQRLAEIATKV